MPGDAVEPPRQRLHPAAAPDYKASRIAWDASARPDGKSHAGDDEEQARSIADADLHQNHKQTYHGRLLLWVSFQSVGVVYGDIGTSPLYVYSSTFDSQPSWHDLVGVLSLIIWSITLIVTLKYCFIVLAADDDGQGGAFALYGLLARHMKIVKEDPRSNSSKVNLQRSRTNDLKSASRGLRRFLEQSPAAKMALKVIAMVGLSLVMAEGVLAPAQSVLGAIQGIRVANPDLGSPSVIGVSCMVLVLLFCLQAVGTSRLGTAFAPIVTIWLLFNLATGIYNLVSYDHTVLKAFSPYFAFAYFRRNGSQGWRSLGGVLLAFTGVEALFADLGAFSKRAIQISWLCLAFPCLLLAYIGQAAYISADAAGTAYTNPFFYTVPPGTLYFGLLLAVLAAIVASQALITSTFQLLSQVMRLSYFPYIRVIHTSERFYDQVYIPTANWLMMIGTVAFTAAFKNTSTLGDAYGVCVILVALISTFMVSLVAILIWQVPVWLVLPVFFSFAALDATYASAALTKIPDGAWVTLLLATILSSVFVLWRYGKESQWAAESARALPPASLITLTSRDDTQRLAGVLAGAAIRAIDGLGVFFDKTGDPAVLPTAFSQFLRKFAARPRVLVFCHLRPLPVPHVPLSERYVVSRTQGVGPGCYRVVLRHGYADHVLRPSLGHDLVGQIERALATRAGGDGMPAAELDALYAARRAQTVYVLGKETIKLRDEGAVGLRPLLRRACLNAFLWIRENSRPKLAQLDIDADRLVEVGFVTQI